MNVGSRTETGHVRRRNEDALLVAGEAGIFVVADGLGGHPAGDVASATAVRRLREVLAGPAAERLPSDPVERLVSAVAEAHEAVVTEAGRAPGRTGMGTTVVVVQTSADTAWVAHVGDSRCYLLHDGRLEQVTRDHSMAGYLTQALGLDGDVRPDLESVQLAPGDRLLLCTDGLTNMVDDDEIAALLGSGSAQQACDRLTEAALAAGGVDNVTTVVLVA